MKNQNQALAHMKTEYESVKMPEFQAAQIKETIRRAKADNRRVTARRKSLAGIAAAIVLMIALPNASPTVARAMSDVPVLGGVIRVVTFRNYTYEDESHSAQIDAPQLVADGDAGLADTTDEINAEIEKITAELTDEFQKSLQEDGHLDMKIRSEIVTATEELFTLRLICYQAAASGYEENHYYTVDLRTGERLCLSDLFTDGADYVTPISEEIKRQMRERMAADENETYWLDSGDPEWDFNAIEPDAEFYLNEHGELVISFNEGDAAPMYMGVVTFAIPDEVIANIRK